MLKIHQFFYNGSVPSQTTNILGNKCIVYSLSIQACPGSKFQIGDGGEVVIGNNGNFSINTEQYPIKKIIIKSAINTEAYPMIIDIIYKGEIPNER